QRRLNCAELVMIDRPPPRPVYWCFALSPYFGQCASSHSACAASQSRPPGISEIRHPSREISLSVRWSCEQNMSSVKATQLRPGMVIQHESDLYSVFSTEHRTPGNKRGSMQTRMKNLRTGAIIDYRFRAEEFVERAILDEIEFEYLYKEGDEYH